MNQAIRDLNSADAFSVEGSPLLTSHECDDGDLRFSWTDGDNEFAITVSAEEAAKSDYSGTALQMTDEEGDLISIELFKLKPIYRAPRATISHWLSIFDGCIKQGLASSDTLEAVMNDLIEEFICDDREGWIEMPYEYSLNVIFTANDAPYQEVTQHFGALLETSVGYPQSRWCDLFSQLKPVSDIRAFLES